MKKLLLSCLSGSLFGLATFAQGNDCATAPLITQGTTCVATTGTTAGATESMLGCSGDAEDDVWYRFVATSTVANIYAIGNGNFDMVLELFSGTCGSLTSLGCVDNTVDSEEESYSYGGLTVGQTYYLRLYDWYDTPPSALTFTLCITAPCGTLTQPAGSVAEAETCGADSNGGCIATPAPVYQDITCGTTVWGSVWADADNRDTDWYRFTLASPTQVTWTVASELPAAIYFVNISNCASPVVMANALTDGCAPKVLTYNFTAAGTYVAFVAPAGFNGYPCGTYNDYSATLTMTTTTPVISAGGATTVCSPATVGLTSTGTGTFVWSNGGTPISGATSSTYSAAATGTYTVELTNANGCKSTSNAIPVTVNSSPATPTVTPDGPTTFCSGEDVVLTSSAATGNTWSNGATTQSITVNAAGTYTVTATAGGCTSPASATQTITVNTLDNATYAYPTNSICDMSPNQTPTTSSAGTFSATPTGLVFANTATGEINVGGSAPGTYTVTYTTSGACPATSSQTIVISGNPDATFTYANLSYCSNGTNPNPVFGTGASAGVFSSTAGLVINASNGAINLASSTPGTFTVTNSIAANGSCPADSHTFEVTVATAPTATVSGGGTQCGTGSFPVSVALSGPGPWNITYTDGTTPTTVTGVTTPTYTFNATTSGTYTVTNVTMGTCSAVGTGTASVVFHTNPTVTFTPVGNVCDNASPVTLVGLPVGGSFSGSTGVSGTTFNPSGLTPGPVTLTYSYTDANNCSGIATSTFTLNAAPTATLGAFTEVCEQTAAFGLTGGLPAGGTYSGAGVTGGNFNPATAGEGTQTITYTVTENGCTDAASQTIVVEDCAGIKEVADFGLEIYPNPATSAVTIKAGKDVTFSMMSEDGKVVYPTASLSMNTETQLQVSHLARGIYFLHFTGTQGNLVQKVIVK